MEAAGRGRGFLLGAGGGAGNGLVSGVIGEAICGTATAAVLAASVDVDSGSAVFNFLLLDVGVNIFNCKFKKQRRKN